MSACTRRSDRGRVRFCPNPGASLLGKCPPPLAVMYHCTMKDDEVATDAVGHGEPPPATVDEDKYTLSINDAIERYKSAGIPRIRRTVQRYCSNKTLDAHRFAIPYGEKYLITPESLERHIAYILQGEAAMANRGGPRSDAPFDIQPTRGNLALRGGAEDQRFGMSDRGEPRSEVRGKSETASDGGEVIDMLRDENKFLKEQIAVKDAQLAVKDRQISDQSERVRETNLLVASLHKLLTPLIGQGEPFKPFSAPNSDDIPPPPQ